MTMDRSRSDSLSVLLSSGFDIPNKIFSLMYAGQPGRPAHG